MRAFWDVPLKDGKFNLHETCRFGWKALGACKEVEMELSD